MTDAYLISGYLSEKGLLGGRVPLQLDLARQAFLPVAAAFGLDVEGVAESAIQVATSTMLAKILPFLARQGFGPTDLSLLIYGGAGGVHGPILADEVGIQRIVVPRIPSVFCAYGGLVSDLVHDGVRTMRGSALASASMLDAYAELELQGAEWVKRQSFVGQVTAVERLHIADMRYGAQSFSVPVDVTRAMASGDPAGASVVAFHAEHERLFGHAERQSPVAIDDLRLKTIGRQAKPPATPFRRDAATDTAPRQARPIRFGSRTIPDVPVHAWDQLSPGWSSQGPAIIEQDLATILVPPTYLVRVGEFGDLDLVAGS